MVQNNDSRGEGFTYQLGETLKAIGRGWLGIYKGAANLAGSAGKAGIAVYDSQYKGQNEARVKSEQRFYAGAQRDGESDEAYKLRAERTKARKVTIRPGESQKAFDRRTSRYLDRVDAVYTKKFTEAETEAAARGESLTLEQEKEIHEAAKRYVYAGRQKAGETDAQYVARAEAAMNAKWAPKAGETPDQYKARLQGYKERIAAEAPGIFEEQTKKSAIKGLEKKLAVGAVGPGLQAALGEMNEEDTWGRKLSMAALQLKAAMFEAFMRGREQARGWQEGYANKGGSA